MSRAYSSAPKKLQEDPAKPFNRRNYVLILLNPKKAEFDEDQTTLKAVTETKGNEPIDRVVLRTQQINDPKSTTGGARLLQFFAQDPNRGSLVTTAPHTSVIAEVDGSKETPLFYLNSDETRELVRGAGFNAQILTTAVSAGR